MVALELQRADKHNHEIVFQVFMEFQMITPASWMNMNVRTIGPCLLHALRTKINKYINDNLLTIKIKELVIR